MVLSNYSSPKPSHVILANVGSGDTFFINIDTRTIVGCVNTVGGFNGAGGTTNAHASTASPDNSMVIVANIGAKGESDFYTKNSHQLH